MRRPGRGTRPPEDRPLAAGARCRSAPSRRRRSPPPTARCSTTAARWPRWATRCTSRRTRRRRRRRCCTSSRATPWPAMALPSRCRPRRDALEVGAHARHRHRPRGLPRARGRRAGLRRRLHGLQRPERAASRRTTGRRCASRRATASCRSARGSLAARHVADPDALAGAWCSIDGREAQRYATAGMQRGVARLIADVSGFMTLAARRRADARRGAGAPRARAGQTVRITIERHRHAGTSRWWRRRARMKHARVA